jgi:myo-inositol-1(or 4)-monophosphatase
MAVNANAMLALASKAARAAADVLRGARASQMTSKSNPRDLVTEWDPRSEQTIREVLADSGYPVLGEELGTGDASVATEGATHRWVVDPIDGTVNFAHGIPIWSISIALEEIGQGPIVGVVYAPVVNWWFEATRGGGARDGNGNALRVSTVDRLDRAMLTTGFPYDLATHPVNNLAEWSHLQRVAGTCRRFGVASLDLCFVASGWCDGYWERRLAPWDIAAGALIVVEAGGIVTNTTGGSFDAHSGEAVASNGAIHDELVRELARVPPERLQ